MSAASMACFVDTLGHSHARLCVSIATLCHDLGIDTANSCKACLLSVPCCARALQRLKPYRTHVCQCFDLGCLCVHPCLGPGHSCAHPHIAPDCSCMLSRVLSATSHHGPSIHASTGKARCVLSVPPCTSALGCLSVVIATPCRNTNTCVLHARVHASACTRAHAHTCPCVRAHTPRRCMACPLDATHSSCVPVAVAPCHDALDFGPQTCMP
ncbi:hypothetical protein SLEP1_g23985 [Rubroshorea leprosula]|uniref:Uncharacterized protein n=1 Tax=Rubroshorea leprosula TaxID=152421 RepID=A0AAV5JQ50_9ROSI|nr:hypothetical protein SLEP1_g23985 [Rubroshorea leprosula]